MAYTVVRTMKEDDNVVFSFQALISETAEDNPINIILKNGLQSTGESTKSGLEAVQGRITKLAFYGDNKGLEA